MPSIISGYEYDIFISYRQNDNRSGWVTEFVKSLQEELSATIKQPVSVYFDSDLHDGLLETHNVDKSLEGKLKCLIFIPILSQTYCDPESFAWQHEFLAFNKCAAEDPIGLQVKLRNGNVAGRVLPVKIHDLDPDDLALLEKELKGKLRSIDFIFKASGVNRPLRPDDERPENNNHTLYRDQINKVANAIGDIIGAVKQPQNKAEPPPTFGSMDAGFPKKSPVKKVIFIAVALMIIMAMVFGISQYMTMSSKKEEIDKSIAVLPFVNMSNDPDQEYFSDGLSEELLNRLTKISELKVIGRTSSFSFKGKNDDLRVIADKLGVAYILEGSVRKSNNKFRITAQLIKAADASHLWSETYDREIEDILKVQDEIAMAVVKHLRVTLFNNTERQPGVANKEAYDLYLKGKYFFALGGRVNFEKALQYYNEGLRFDSSSAQLWAALASVLDAQVINASLDAKEGIKKVRQAAEKAIALDNDLADGHIMLGNIKAYYEFDWKSAAEEIEKANALDPGNVDVVLEAANFASALNDNKKAFILFNRAIELDPVRNTTYHAFGSYFFQGEKFNEARKQFRKALELNPTRYYTYSWIACTYLLENKLDSALLAINKETDGIRKAVLLPLMLYAVGRVDESDSALNKAMEKYRYLQAQFLAMNYAWRGDNEKALDLLEQAYTNREFGIHWARKTPTFKNIWKHPRFIALFKKMNLAAQ